MSNLLIKYYSIVPLHLLFLNFAIYYLPNKLLSTSNDHQQPSTQITPTLHHLIQHPIPSLLIINLATLLVQLWFSNFLRSYKFALSPTPANRVHQPQKLSLSQLNTILRHLISLPPSQLPKSLAKQFIPQLGPSILRTTLLLKEVFFINSFILLTITTLIVLVGGPIYPISKLLNTLALACFLTLISFFPASLILGWNQGREKSNWIRIFSAVNPKNQVEVALLFPAIGACLGSWLGALPIPLDWDRPWQAWPVSCLVGASLGHALGSLGSIIHSLSSSP